MRLLDRLHGRPRPRSSHRPTVMALVLLPTVSLLLLAALSAWRAAADNEAHVVEQRVTLARSIGQAATSYVSGHVATVRTLALTSTIAGAADEPPLQDFLESVLAANPTWDGFGVYDEEGWDVASAAVAPHSVNVGDRPYFRQVLDGGQPVVSPALIARTTGAQVVAVAVPVQFAGGGRGVLVATLKAAQLGQALTALYGGPGFEIVVVDQDGQALVHPDPAFSRAIRTLDDRAGVAEVLAGRSGSETRPDAAGVEQLTAYAPLPDLGWGVLVRQSVSAAFGPARRQLLLEWGLLGMTAALTSACAWFLSGRLARLYKLQEAAMKRSQDAAAQLSAQLAFTSAITRYLGEGVYALDRTGRLTFMNPAAERMLGWREAELLGRSAHGVVHCRRGDGSVLPTEECPILEVARRGVMVQTDDDTFTRRDGSLLPVAYTSSPIVVGGETVGAVVAFHDITASKQSEAALRGAARMREEFLAMVSHELRTPLTAVLGYADILLRQRHGPLNERQRRHAGGIREAAHRQLALVNDLLDVSKLEAGKVEVGLAPVDPQAVVARASTAMQVIAAEKGVELRAAPPEPASGLPRIMADEDRLHQILVNLLSNAIKFTPPGGTVTAGAALAPAPPGVPGPARPGVLWAYVAFRVTDTGVGIAPEHLAHIWDRFYQADSSSTRRFGGTGLGLTIVKRLTELHGGQVQAASAGAGQGATFTVWIPVAPAAARNGFVSRPAPAETAQPAGRPAGPPAPQGALTEVGAEVGAPPADTAAPQDAVVHPRAPAAPAAPAAPTMPPAPAGSSAPVGPRA